MELNNLLTSIKKQETDTKKYLALELGPDSVKSAVWEVSGSKATLVHLGSVETADPTNLDQFLQAVDTSISKAILGIVPEPNEVVFSVPESWVESEDISKEKKAVLKHISQQLELKPLGFVVTHEAIIHYLHHKKGQPPTAIIIGVSNDEIAVTLTSNGESKGTQVVGRSDDMGSDIEEGIARFGSISNLPANIILYDGHCDLEELKQNLISFNWQERLPFLHIPKIDCLTTEETIKAVVMTGGAEVIKALEVSRAGDVAEPAPSSSQSSESETTEEDLPDLSEEFGFKVSHPNTEVIDESQTNDDIIGESNLQAVPEQSFIQDVESDGDESDTDITPKPSVLQRIWPFAKPKTTLTRGVNLKLPVVLLIAVSLLLIVVGAAIAGYWFLPTAKVTIYVDPKVIDRDLNFTIDPNLTQAEISLVAIPGRPVETEVTAEATVVATGEKLVGEKAKGVLNLYNRTDSVKTFAAGTRLATNSLVFILDNDVQIASASSKENSDLSVTTQPAVKEVSVTAENIGAQYNIGKDTEFSVANFDKSSYVAKAKTEILGGSSREITAVSKQDITQLKQQVRKELETKATDQVAQTPETFISAVILTDQDEALTQEFSAEVGDEANEVSLNATLKVNTMTYKKSDLQLLLEQILINDIPKGYALVPSDSGIEPTSVVVGANQTVAVTAKAKVTIIPQLNTSEIANTIKGKFPQVTESYFKSLPSFAKVEIDIRPNVPPKFKTFPKIPTNITVEVKNR